MNVDSDKSTVTSFQQISNLFSSQWGKKFFLFLGMLVFFLLTTSSAYFLGRSQNNLKISPSPSLTPPTLSLRPTTDLKENETYTDSKYSFTFTYPQKLQFKPCPDRLCGTFIDRASNLEVIKLEGFGYSCDVTLNPSFDNAKKAAICMCLADGPGIHVSCDTPTEEEIVTTSSGTNGYRFVLNELLNNKFNKQRGPYTFIFFPKPISYELGLYFELVEKNSIPQLDQILSTFRFTNTGTPVGQFCGGFAGIECPLGSSCKLDGNYPDAGGKCIAN